MKGPARLSAARAAVQHWPGQSVHPPLVFAQLRRHLHVHAFGQRSLSARHPKLPFHHHRQGVFWPGWGHWRLGLPCSVQPWRLGALPCQPALSQPSEDSRSSLQTLLEQLSASKAALVVEGAALVFQGHSGWRLPLATCSHQERPLCQLVTRHGSLVKPGVCSGVADCSFVQEPHVQLHASAPQVEPRALNAGSNLNHAEAFAKPSWL